MKHIKPYPVRGGLCHTHARYSVTEIPQPTVDRRRFIVNLIPSRPGDSLSDVTALSALPRHRERPVGTPQQGLEVISVESTCLSPRSQWQVDVTYAQRTNYNRPASPKADPDEPME